LTEKLFFANLKPSFCETKAKVEKKAKKSFSSFVSSSTQRTKFSLTIIYLICLKLTNLKKEKEKRPMASGKEIKQKAAERFWRREDKKEERR